MSSYVIWMDSREAKVFDLVPGGPKVRHLKTHGQKHHSEPHGKHSQSHHPEAEALFKDLATSIQDAKEILLVGPADAKTHFRTYLDKHFSGSLAKKVLAVETLDHPTDPQILAYARKFFKAHDLFEG